MVGNHHVSAMTFFKGKSKLRRLISVLAQEFRAGGGTRTHYISSWKASIHPNEIRQYG